MTAIDGTNAGRHDLFRQQEALQAEATEVEIDLGLDVLVGSLGDPVRVGSAALGLMVGRDLDFTVVCTELDVERVATVGARLGTHPRIRQIVFRNDTGSWNAEPQKYPDGIYLGIEYRSLARHDWKIDIWFIDEPDRQPDLRHLRAMPSQLSGETREAILLIKNRWASRPEYGKTVSSFDIYQAVLSGGVRTQEQFEDWLAGRGTTS